MAGDWIKMTHELPEKPEVLALSNATKINRYEVIGRLFILWRWFDNHTKDGNAHSVTSVTLNEALFGYNDDTQFVTEVKNCGWLIEENGVLSVKNFEYHISESAKTRAQTGKRVKRSRNGKRNGDSVTEALPEKRREDINNPAESGTDPIWGFGLDWLGGKSMRPFLGKQVSQYGADVVSAALDRCMAQGNVVDPKSYFLKLLEGEDKKPKAWVPGQKRDVRSYT